MIKWGSLVSAASAFWLCENKIWASVLFVIQLSIGEAFYSPRLYEYSMRVSPKGGEGIYTALASAPLFVTTFAIGPLSGWLLTRYCSFEAGHRLNPTCTIPDTFHGKSGGGGVSSNECNECPTPGLMWAILGAIAFAGPILIFLTEKWIPNGRDSKDEDPLHIEEKKGLLEPEEDGHDEHNSIVSKTD